MRPQANVRRAKHAPHREVLHLSLIARPRPTAARATVPCACGASSKARRSNIKKKRSVGATWQLKNRGMWHDDGTTDGGARSPPTDSLRPERAVADGVLNGVLAAGPSRQPPSGRDPAAAASPASLRRAPRPPPRDLGAQLVRDPPLPRTRCRPVPPVRRQRPSSLDPRPSSGSVVLRASRWSAPSS